MFMSFCLRYCTCCFSPRTLRRARQQQAVNDMKHAKIVVTRIDRPARKAPPPTSEQIGEAFTKLGAVMEKMQPAIAEARITIPATGQIVSAVANSASVIVDSVTSVASKDPVKSVEMDKE